MSSEDEINQKKTMIQSQIIDAGYDQESFFNFCQSKKTGGEDITNWTVEELNEAIHQYVTKTKEDTQKDAQNEDKDKDKDKDKANQDLKNDIEKINTMKDAKVDYQKYEKEIVCKKLEKTPLNDKEVKVILRNPKTSDSSFLQSTYVTYEVLTESMQWLVKRRFSDFVWLRTILVKCFPRLLVPPLPGKKMGARRFEKDFIEKRMLFLQKFIDNVMENESFKTSEALVAFLSMIDKDQFECKMREMTTFQPSIYVDDSKTLTGKILVVDIEENEKYYSNIVHYFRIQDKIFDQLNENMKKFYKGINVVCKSMEGIQKNFETLHLLNTKVLMKEEITNTYQELGYFFKNWKRIFANQNETVKSRIKDFFKYIRMEGESYSELIQSRENIKAKYKLESERVKAKKERLWSLNDINRWEIIDEFNKIDRNRLLTDKNYAIQNMCTNETISLENLHKQLGYANKMNMDELRRLISNNVKRYQENNKAFTEEFYPSLTDAITVWSSLSSHI